MEKSMGALEGKVAVITGGNSVIGLATAQRFVKEGAYVFITGRRQAELDKAVSLIGKNVTAVRGDVSKPDDLDHLYEVVRKKKGRVDIVFANAGVVDPVSLANSTPETYDKHFNPNARGAYFTVQKALPLLADKASIILSGSAAWQMEIPGYGACSATKAALVSFARSWTAELSDRGIRANVISPGPTETPMIHVGSKGSPEGTSEYFRKMIPMERRMSLHRRRCSSRPTRAALSQASTCLSMVAQLPGKPCLRRGRVRNNQLPTILSIH
jgi:NAD(P)-dependent dehydrogenase (short-subunit alcohol dehydrogenase family)